MAILTGSENLTAKFYIEGVYVGNGIASNAAGPNGAIQFNSNGNFAGSSNLLYTDANGGTLTTGTLVVDSIVTPSGNLAITDLVSNGTIAGNVITANVMAANTANIANLTSNVITANTGNIANLTSNVITANTGNIANLTSNIITANTGNIANLTSNVITANTANLVDLSVTGNANLGDVSNVHIGGGSPGQFLQTDSTGNLVWADAATGNAIPYMNWTVPIDGPGQSFVNANIALYNDPTDMSVFLNGVFVNPIDFTILNDTITFSSSLKSTDSIEIASKSAGTGGGGGTGTGTVTRVGGTGAGLGFTLTGNVTTSGNLLLTTPNATSLRTSLNLGNVANVNLNGNSSTVLSGNGAWIGTVPNAIIATTALNVMATGVVGAVANAEYSVLAETANSVALANVVGIGNIANINLNGNVLTVLAGNGQWVPQANSNGVAGVSQIVAGNGIVLSPSNGIGIVTVSANLSNVTVANANVANTANGLQATVANTIITGGTTGQMIITNGSGNLSFATPNVGTVTRVQGNGSGLGFSLSGNVTSSGNLTLVVPNSTSLTSSMGLGNVSSLNFNGNGSTVLAGNGAWVTQSGSTLFSYATEVVTLVTHTTGTYTHDLLTSSIVFSTAVATGPVVVAYRGNVSTTVNTLLSVGTSITATYVMTTGSTGYAVTGITVDGTSQTVNWAGGTTPSVVANTKMSYTFTIVKTAANTYTVLGSATRFG